MRQWYPLLETLLGWTLVLLVASAGVFMARGLWLVLEPSPGVSVSVDWEREVTSTQGERVGPERDARAVAESRWFGDPADEPAAPEPEPVAVVDAPETRLEFRLRGVMAGSDPTAGSALISRRSGDSEYFRVGDAIFDQAELVEVYGNRVILSRDGEMETLSFEGETLGGADNPTASNGGSSQQPATATGSSGQQSAASGSSGGSQSASSGGSGGGNNASQAAGSASNSSGGSAQRRLEEDLRQAITEVQSRAQSDPQGLLRQYGLEATGNGYRVTSRAGILIANGLRPGDRITEINDQPVGDVDRDQALVDSVLQSDQIKITLERSGATYRFYQSLPNF